MTVNAPQQSKSLDFVTDQHLLAFGAIIHRYAHCESGIRMALSPLLGISRVDVLVLTEPLSSAGLHNVAKSLVKAREPQTDASKQLLAHTDKFEEFRVLRNRIAHDRWMRGDRSNSIKPARINIHSGSIRVSGIFEGEKDYTPEELFDVANALGDLSHCIRDWLVEYDPDSKNLLALSDDALL